MPRLHPLGVVVSALWAVWWLGCGLVVWGCLRAARDLHDDEPVQPSWDADVQAWRHAPIPLAPDDQPGTRGDWEAICTALWALPAHQPTNHTTEGDQ